MRHEKSEHLLKLAQRMQSSADGVTLKDIENMFNVHRRTAERMRTAVLQIFPEIEEFTHGDKIKRWRMRSSSLMRLSCVSLDELADLQTAIQIMEDANLTPQSQRLENLLHKIKGTVNQQQSYRIETDLEALLEGEGYLTRPGPKFKINTNVFATVRQGIKAQLKLKIRYNYRHGNEITERIVSPYGILYGKKHYLVAWCKGTGEEPNDGVRKFLLSNIIDIQITNEYFEQSTNFNLQEYSQQSFGVFTDDPMNVKWKFSPDVADDLNHHIFHPQETRETLDDGSILVSFTAGGKNEMCWYLFTWENYVEILEPQELKDHYNQMLKRTIKTNQD